MTGMLTIDEYGGRGRSADPSAMARPTHRHGRGAGVEKFGLPESFSEAILYPESERALLVDADQRPHAHPPATVPPGNRPRLGPGRSGPGRTTDNENPAGAGFS